MSSTDTEMTAFITRHNEVTRLAGAEPQIAAAVRSAEPQQMFTDLAARCPVRKLNDDTFSLSTMDDIRYVNRHPAVEQGAKYLGSNRPAIPLGLDGPRHTGYRRLLDPVFSPKRVDALAPQVAEVANKLIDSFIDKGEIDAYRAWCEPLPSTIFLTIMGLPFERLEEFLHFKDLTLGHHDRGTPDDRVIADRMEAVQWIQDYFSDEIDARLKAPTQRDDMIGWLMSADVDDKKLTREELLDVLGLLMIAGLDTVTSSLACFLSYFARHPEDRAKVVADPSMTRTALEELMRFESPVTEGLRIATEDLALPSGVTIPAGAWMHMSWSAANLDPRAFPNPLQVNLNRKPNAHMAFASGTHRCLGSHLARMEMATAIQVWHERIPDYAIAPGQEVVYSVNPRAPQGLVLTFS